MENKTTNAARRGSNVDQRLKMPIARRAKQFMPFAALSGLDDALAQKEWEISARQSANHRIVL